MRSRETPIRTWTTPRLPDGIQVKGTLVLTRVLPVLRNLTAIQRGWSSSLGSTRPTHIDLLWRALPHVDGQGAVVVHQTRWVALLEPDLRRRLHGNIGNIGHGTTPNDQTSGFSAPYEYAFASRTLSTSRYVEMTSSVSNEPWYEAGITQALCT